MCYKKRSSDKDKQTANKKLKHDIVKSVQNCFGNHDKYSADFCKTKTSAYETHVVIETNHNSSTVPEVMLEQDEIWKKITNENLLEVSRFKSGVSKTMKILLSRYNSIAT